MDTTTHALAGYVIARAGLNRSTGKWGTVAAVAAAVFPDLDLVLRLFGTEFSLKYHRALTNSVLLVVPVALLFAWLFVRVSKVRKFWSFFLIWTIVMCAHTFLDLATSYGTMLLSPFWDCRFSLDWLFIIDIFLVSALLLPLVVSFFWRRKKTVFARIALAMAVLYIGLCAWSHSRALSLIARYVRENNLAPLAIASLPQPLSPFNWANLVLTEEKVYQGLVNLVASEDETTASSKDFLARFKASYQPVSQLRYRQWQRFDESPWVERALGLKEAKTFFWFARFPIVRDGGVVDGKHRVEFIDLRFGSVGTRRPFRYVLDFDESGKVVFKGFL